MTIEIQQQLTALHEDERGATATEYVILLILIACFIIMIVGTFGETLSHKYRTAYEYFQKMVGY